MSKNIVFDIETGPLPDSELVKFMPDEDEWKIGNVKDPQKRLDAIVAKRKEWVEEAPLDPLTGQVLAIGLLIGDEFICISEPATEAIMLHEFWTTIQEEFDEFHHLIGFNCFLFDLPFMIRRSWKLKVSVPSKIRQGRYWHKQVTDLRDVWQCGDRQAHGSLDTIAKHLGVGEKTANGADLHKLWLTDKPKAIAYLQNDLWLTAAIARKLGVL